MQSNLNEKQKEAVELGLGPAMILAGPGSGKTTVLLHRIQYLIDELHISPKNILVITFTKAAAREMQERAAKILNLKAECPFFGTFHSYFYSILKRSYEYRNYSIMTTKQKYNNMEALLKSEYPDMRISNNLLQEILSCFSKQKNNVECLKEMENLGFTKEQFQDLFEKYNYFNFEQKQMDYDDILFLAQKLLQDNIGALNRLNNEVKYVLVDEFQDVNKMQYELLIQLAEKHNNLFVVGDDDQSIYCFRGAYGDNFRQFSTDFSNVQNVILNINYRCPSEIVDISSKLISHNQNRFQKQLISGKESKGFVQCKCFISKDEERKYVVEKMKEFSKRNAGGTVAILCRTNSQLSYFAERLKKEKVKFYMKEKNINFYDSTFIKPIIGYLMFASKVDKSRKRLFSFMNRPMRFINRELFANWDETKVKFDELDIRDVKILQLKEEISRIGRMSPQTAISYILKGIGYEEFVLAKCTSKDEVERFRADMDELRERAGMYQTIREWMEYVKLEEKMDLEEWKKEEFTDTNVFLYTFHGAKGLEFDNVFIPHLNEGSVPYGKKLSKEELEEERRMFYVAITRSAKNLSISFVENNTKKDTVSRFIKECAITVSK